MHVPARHRPAGALAAVLIVFCSVGALAQDQTITPQSVGEEEGQRITPPGQRSDAMLSTRKQEPAPAGEPLPWKKENTAVTPPAALPAKLPFAVMNKPASGRAPLPANVPFGRATMAPNSYIPSEPHTAIATPVGEVDAVEASEPAPPTPPAPGADPAVEDPATPTELTSPLFDDSDDIHLPRKLVFRVLNKVTAQSALYKVKPGEMITFGKLEVTGITCRVAAQNSQADAAGLLSIREQLPGKDGIKSLFRGWMYVSSPSIAALEHPIYDVMMVGCEVATPAPKEEPKPAKKPAAKAKK